MSILNVEKKMLFDKAIMAVADEVRESDIACALQQKELDKTTKSCPNCHKRYDKTCRKCPMCGVFYQKFLNENVDTAETLATQKNWSTDTYYAHVKNCHPQERHSVKVLDPMLDNPNSKLNILALCHHVYKVANIEKDKDENGNSRQWTFIAADAAIANQVTYIQSTPA